MDDNRIISNIKSLGIDMINNACSGHPGIVLGAAPILYCLYRYHLNINPNDPTWINRDRFVLSAGHGSALLYSTLFMSGFDLSIDDLKCFRRANSKTPGHPEVGITPGVDSSTGALGQGIGTAVGMALGEKLLSQKNNNIDYKVYVLVGDGDLMEGVSYEACSLAGTLKLNNLIILYDSNNNSLDGSTNLSFNENVIDRFKSMGYNTYLINNGNNLSEINSVIRSAKESDLPSFIEIKTKIGEGLSYEGTSKAHGGIISNEELISLKNKLGVDNIDFYYNEEYRNYMKNEIVNRVIDKYNSTNFKHNNKEYNLFNNNWIFKNTKEATRDSNIVFMDYLSNNIDNFIGGSADLGSTTKTYLNKKGDITFNNYSGHNIWFGVREHAMGTILNGLALVGFKPYGSTFLSFSDYMKPAIRMSAIMNLPVIYIFSHDSVLIGPDGPTHQPIEQLASLRSIPNMKVFRPADSKELLACWQIIINSNNNPSSLILSRTETIIHDNTDSQLALNGGYIYLKEKSNLKYTIVSSGTELLVARTIGEELNNLGYDNFRIVSMPSIEQYLLNNDEYKNSIIDNNSEVIVIEAGSSFGWHRICSNKIHYITIDNFGISGNKDEVLEYLNYTYDDIKNKVYNIMNIK